MKGSHCIGKTDANGKAVLVLSNGIHKMSVVHNHKANTSVEFEVKTNNSLMNPITL